MTYRLSNSRKSNVATELMRVPLMVLASQVTIGSLNFFLGGVLCHTQGGMEIAPWAGSWEDPAGYRREFR